MEKSYRPLDYASWQVPLQLAVQTHKAQGKDDEDVFRQRTAISNVIFFDHAGIEDFVRWNPETVQKHGREKGAEKQIPAETTHDYLQQTERINKNLTLWNTLAAKRSLYSQMGRVGQKLYSK